MQQGDVVEAFREATEVGQFGGKRAVLAAVGRNVAGRIESAQDKDVSALVKTLRDVLDELVSDEPDSHIIGLGEAV